jgi:hypothetical protein
MFVAAKPVVAVTATFFPSLLDHFVNFSRRYVFPLPAAPVKRILHPDFINSSASSCVILLLPSALILLYHHYWKWDPLETIVVFKQQESPI